MKPLNEHLSEALLTEHDVYNWDGIILQKDLIFYTEDDDMEGIIGNTGCLKALRNSYEKNGVVTFPKGALIVWSTVKSFDAYDRVDIYCEAPFGAIFRNMPASEIEINEIFNNGKRINRREVERMINKFNDLNLPTYTAA
jgi:hypothetical protein